MSLAARTWAALETVVSATGDNKTDSINKAISFYAEIRQIVADGGVLYIKEPGAAELERVRFF